MSKTIYISEIHETSGGSATKHRLIKRMGIYLKETDEIITASLAYGTKRMIMDMEDPTDQPEALEATIVALSTLAENGMEDLEAAFEKRRRSDLSEEIREKSYLHKSVDRLFERQAEWIALRNFLAGEMPREGDAKEAKKGYRALVIIG